MSCCGKIIVTDFSLGGAAVCFHSRSAASPANIHASSMNSSACTTSDPVMAMRRFLSWVLEGEPVTC